MERGEVWTGTRNLFVWLSVSPLSVHLSVSRYSLAGGWCGQTGLCENSRKGIGEQGVGVNYLSGPVIGLVSGWSPES